MDEKPLPLNRTLMQLAALRDAVHLADTRPLEELDVQSLTSATASVYIACGFTDEEATVMVADSVNRTADRFIAAMREADSSAQ